MLGHSQPGRTMRNKWAINEYREATANWSCVFNWFAYLSLFSLSPAIVHYPAPYHCSPLPLPCTLKACCTPPTAIYVLHCLWQLYRKLMTSEHDLYTPLRPTVQRALSFGAPTAEGANELGFSLKTTWKLFHLKLIIWAECFFNPLQLTINYLMAERNGRNGRNERNGNRKQISQAWQLTFMQTCLSLRRCLQ